MLQVTGSLLRLPLLFSAIMLFPIQEAEFGHFAAGGADEKGVDFCAAGDKGGKNHCDWRIGD